MRIIRGRRVAESHWRHVPEGSLADAEPAQGAESIIVSLADWRQSKSVLLNRPGPVGVRLASGVAIDEIAADLDSIALVAVEFSSVTEGRGYSQARLLRDRHAYRGEIRAVGDVSRDRLAFMERCGFNAYELRPDCDPEDALKAFAEISVIYQTATGGQPPVAGGRRRPRLEAGPGSIAACR